VQAAVIVLVFVLCAAPAAGQVRLEERVDVVRLVVDVRALDPGGAPIRGLGPDDFRVWLDGRPARIESVIWTGSPVHAADDETAPSAAAAGTTPGRRLVFFVQKDLHPSRAPGLLRMLDLASELLDGLAPGDEAAVLSFDSHLKLWADFTADRTRLRHALTRSVLFDRSPRPGPPQGGRQPAASASTLRLARADARRAATVERGLLLTARALAEVDGPKSLIFIGYGFGRLGGAGVEMSRDYEQARHALTDARTAVFSLDVTNADYHSLERGLQLAAQDTGGLYFRTHVFPGTAMARLQEALHGSYVLFVERSDASARERDPVRVRVELAGRRGEVLYTPSR
jgi:VWFA-related protein